MSSTLWEAGATDVTTFWRAWDAATGEDYAGAEINHNATGLRIGYYRPGASAVVEAVTAGSPAPVDLAALNTAHSDWGWRQVVGPYYRADFPDAAFASGVPHVLRWVRGIEGVNFAPVTLDEIMGGDPRAAALTTAQIVSAEIAALNGFTSSDTALELDGVAHTITRNDTDGYITSITAD